MTQRSYSIFTSSQKFFLFNLETIVVHEESSWSQDERPIIELFPLSTVHAQYHFLPFFLLVIHFAPNLIKSIEEMHSRSNNGTWSPFLVVCVFTNHYHYRPHNLTPVTRIAQNLSQLSAMLAPWATLLVFDANTVV